MPINNITQTISELPAAGRRGVDVQTQFVIKQEDFQDHLQGTTVTELNTLKDQLNTRIGEINSTTTTINGYADTASAGASTATTKAGEASTSASGALTSRNQASTFATNSSNSATKSSQWADNNYNVEVETGKYSAKHWSTVAQNTVNNKVEKVTSTDNAIVRFNGTTGEVQSSGVVIDDNNNVNMNNSTTNTFTNYGIGGVNKGYIGDGNWLFGGSTNDFGIRATNNLVFGTGATERMRIDSAGNVGIGVAPSAWGGSFKAIQVGAVGSTYTTSAGDVVFGRNMYNNGTNSLYLINNYASVYGMISGQHQWFIAPSGTAGNAISFTQAMTLGSNGNLLIGTTTDNGIDKLQVNGSISSGRVSIVTDLNEVKTGGSLVTGDFTFSLASNAPCNYGTLHQIARSTEECTQMVIDITNGKLYTRVYLGTTWAAWVEK